MRIKKIALFFIAAFITFSTFAAKEKSGDIEVSLSGFRNNTGTVIINLFNKPEGYPKPENAYQKITLTPKEGLRATFSGVPYGRYSVSVIHDENKDEQFTMRWLPWPQPLEGGGFSNNTEATMGPPEYKKTLFDHKSPKTGQKIKITYP